MKVHIMGTYGNSPCLSQKNVSYLGMGFSHLDFPREIMGHLFYWPSDQVAEILHKRGNLCFPQWLKVFWFLCRDLGSYWNSSRYHIVPFTQVGPPFLPIFFPCFQKSGLKFQYFSARECVTIIYYLSSWRMLMWIIDLSSKGTSKPIAESSHHLFHKLTSYFFQWRLWALLSNIYCSLVLAAGSGHLISTPRIRSMANQIIDLTQPRSKWETLSLVSLLTCVFPLLMAVHQVIYLRC